MEEWNIGRMEKWKDGMLEEWNIGNSMDFHLFTFHI